MATSIETSFQAAIDSGKVNGGLALATNAAGTFTYTQAFGKRTLLSGEQVPEKPDDVLYLASATKLIASIAALQCVEDGTLSLTGDLSTVAPELSGRKVLTGFDDNGDPILEDQVRPITLEMLITHSSGLAYDFLNPLLGQWRKKFPVPEAQPGTRTVELSFDYPLVFQPGASWMYGGGLDWAGRIVERVTKMSLGEFCQKRIFDALGINSAQFYPVTREDLRARMVDLNPGDTDGVGKAVIGSDGAHQRTGKGDFGGHGMYMAGDDFLKVTRSLLANDGKLLKKETVEDMFQSHLSSEAAQGHEAAMLSPTGIFFRLGLPVGTKAGYGLGGLLTQQDTEGWWGEGTMSWGGGMSFVWFIDRKNDIAAVGAVNSSLPLQHGAVNELKQVFKEDVYRKKKAWEQGQ